MLNYQDKAPIHTFVNVMVKVKLKLELLPRSLNLFLQTWKNDYGKQVANNKKVEPRTNLVPSQHFLLTFKAWS